MSTYRGAGVYIIRARRPGLLGRVPLLGRHFAYVGQSGAVHYRLEQHLAGGGKFNTEAKSWADLKPTVRVIPMPVSVKPMLLCVEALLILCTWPVYNYQKNLWNPRRIPLRSAGRQRRMRDRIGWSLNIRPVQILLWAVIIGGVYLTAKGR